MKNVQRGSASLLAVLFTSFLLSLGGAGAAATYFRTNPNEFMTQLRAYLNAHIETVELAPLDDITPTDTETAEVEQDVTVSSTVTPTGSVTPTPKPDSEDSDEDSEEHEGEENEINIKLNADGRFETEFDD